MGFSLKKLVKGVTDGGSPFTTQPQRPQPASTAQAVAPHMQFSPQAQQRIMARNPSGGQAQIARGVNTTGQAVLAQSLLQGTKNPALNRNPAMRGQLLGQANQPQPGKMSYLPNAFNEAINSNISQPFVTRPAAEVVNTVKDVVNGGKPAVYHPQSNIEKQIFGNQPVQSIQQKVSDQYKRQSTSSNPVLRAASKPLAVGEALVSAANDLPVVGGGLKAAEKVGAKGIELATPKFAGLTGKQVIMDTQKLDTLHAALQHPTNVESQQNIINGLHQIKQDHGLDFISGTPNQRTQRISQFLEQNGEAIPQLQAHQAKIANLRNTAIDVQNKYAPGLRTNAVNDAGEQLGMNGQPLKTPVTSTKLVPPQPSEATTKLVSPPPEVPVVPESVSLPKPKTGIKDKQLQDLQTVHKQLVNAEADNIRPIHQPPVNPVSARVRAAGGVSSSAYEDFPKSLVRKAGASADKVAQELGYNSEDELLNALQTEADAKARTLTNTQLKQQALENLQAGKSQHSADYAKLQEMIKQRQDELSQYPNGKYRQVKVTGKPAKMTDAELQSLSQTPEGIAPKKTNLVTVRNEKKVLRNADAERAVVDVLKKGGSTDEALNTYMKATGTDLQTAVADVKRVAAESKLGFGGGKNPLQGTIKLPIVQAGDHGQAFLNADYVKQHETAIGQKALDSFNGLSEHDKTLLQSIEKDTVANVAKKAKDPKAFLAAEKNIRTYYDTRHAYDNALGIDVGYRQNYLRQLFAKAEQEAQATMPDQINIKNGNKNPGYKQHRQYDTLNTHVGTALERDIHGSSTNHAKLAYSEGLHQAYPEQVNTSGQLVRDATGAYKQITNRYGEGVTAQKDIADAINSRSRTPTLSKGLQRYDKANAGLKYVKLGGGAFHALTEAGNFIGQQAISGKLFTEPGASGKVLKTFFSPKTMDAEIVKFRDNGTLDKASLAGLKIMAKDILADANVKLGGKLSKYSGIQALHDATFQREIPYAKLKLFEQKTKGLDVNNPADLTKMRSISAGINDLFGGINRDIEGIKPNSFKALQRFVLATDFTESKVRTAFRSINITDNSPAAQIARQAVVGKVLLFAAVAAGGGALGGEYQGKTPKQIAENILGKLADPSFKAGRYKVALPATHVSEFSRPITPLVHPATKGSAKGDRFAGLQHYATGRLAAVPSEAYQLRTNKDYSGNKLYGKDYAFNGGEQISKGKTAANILSGFTPIPASQGIGVAQGKTDPRAAIANTLGLRVTNEDQYNQDATPVKITTGDTPVSLSKDKAIAYNKAVADQTAILDKQLQASTQFKNANVTDQGAMKKKLHGYINDWQQRSFASANNIPINKAANSSVQAVAKNTLPSNLAKGVAAKTTKTKTKAKTTKATKVKTAKVARAKSTGRKSSGYSRTAFAAALRSQNTRNQASDKALRTLIANAKIKGGSSHGRVKVASVNLKKQSVKKSTYKTKARVA